VLVDTQYDGLIKDLRRSGQRGKLVKAQLRSQRGPGRISCAYPQGERLTLRVRAENPGPSHAQPGRISSTARSSWYWWRS
jgi:hypothetical protein